MTEKTPAQIAAQARAAGRLAAGSTGDAGMPQHAHGFLAREGGLSKETMSDLGFDKNHRIGSMWLFKANDGMTLERATEKLIEGGYLKEGASHSDVISLVKKSITTPQYTAEGWDRIAQAEADARFEDHLAAQEEAAQNDDFDPFESLSADGFTTQDDVLAGYSEAEDPIKLQANADIANAEALGIDIDTLREESYEATKNGSEQDYLEHLSRAIASAIARSETNSIDDAGKQSDPAGEREPEDSPRIADSELPPQTPADAGVSVSGISTEQVTPNRVVINLTREHGAGSLAHEWFHAVDNYFARMRGEKSGMLTEKPYPNGEGVRPEMVMAFRDLMKSITDTGVMARSRNLDKKRTKDYWSTGLEMAARSFESYVIAKLHEQNAANDYLTVQALRAPRKPPNAA